MHRFRRNSKSSVKSAKSRESSTEPPSPSQSRKEKLEPDHEEELFKQKQNNLKSKENEEELFKQIQNHLTPKENVFEAGKTGNMFIDLEKFGGDVESADEAYKTPATPGGNGSKIPKPVRPSDGKTNGPGGQETKTEKVQDKPEPVENPTEGKPGDDQLKDGQPDDGHGKSGGDADGKKKEDIDICMLVNIIMSCTAFTIAVILVTYYILEDLAHVVHRNFRQRWEEVTASLFVKPTFVNKLYEVFEEAFQPIKIRTKNLFAKPAAVKTTESGK